MHLSGIATFTAKFVDQVKNTHLKKQCKILDTRKTTPGYRDLEKRAVVHGGGQNHRQNLSSGILLKDNHIAVMRGITPAVERARQHTKLPLEVEARSLDDVKECVSLNVERILLDNMNNEMTAAAMKLIPDSISVEASGNMSLDRVASVAALGVDFISVGALTHSAPSADLSLLFDWENI
jgi:nicotinate-nucleotide pyrophosphorylase (carboxylating)